MVTSCLCTLYSMLSSFLNAGDVIGGDLVRFIRLFDGPGHYLGMSSKRTPSPRRSSVRAF